MRTRHNTTKIDENIEVYENNIYMLTDEYIDSLPDPNNIYNRITFSGLMNYIYKNLFKPSNTDIIQNNRNSIIDYSNIELLMDVYNIFIDLCSKYKQEYTKNKFLTMIGMSNDTIRNWEKGIKVPDVKGKPRDAWVAFAKKIGENSEKALSDSMLQGNLMAYAQLKCWYNWEEQPQKIIVNNGSAPVLSDQEIAEIAQDKSKDSDIEPDF